jgi:1,4-alpha-glucan branching enzyme
MALELPAVEANHEVEAIVGGYHGDAFRILGPHALPDGRDGEARWIIRAFMPHASSVEVLMDGEAVPMQKKHAHGFYCANFGREPLDYRFRVHLWSGAVEIVDDPYRFPPLLTDFC